MVFDPHVDSWGGLASARWAVRLATVGGVGHSPVAPGTAGSLVGVGLFLALWIGSPQLGSASVGSAYGLGLAGLLVLGIWAAGRAEVELGRADDPRIVIDEVVGQLLTLGPLLWLVTREDFSSLVVGVVTGFVLFRVFDIAKPGAIRWVERRFRGGFGVMFDDVVAGGCGAVVLLGLGWLWSASLAALAGGGS